MKKWIIMFMTLFMISCQEDSGGSGANTAGTPNSTQNVVTPLSTGCLDGTNFCNNTVYNHHTGFIPYPGMYNQAYNYMHRFNRGFCDCPGGYMPVYNSSYGLGCVRQQLLQPYSGFFLYWKWGSGAIGWGYATNYGVHAPQVTINYPQYSNIPSASNSVSSCSKNLTQSCLMNQPNSCGTVATCRQVVAGSSLGVCVSY